MEPDRRRSRKRTEAKIALRSILGEFLANCSVLEPCWYRIISTRNKYIPDTEEPSHISAVSKFFGMNDKLSDDLLLACGLLKPHGEGIRVNKTEWESLRREFRLDDDVEVTAQTNKKLIGQKVHMIRMGLLVRRRLSMQAVRTQNETFKMKRL